MLLLYRASANKLEVELSPTNLFTAVFEPVGDILQPRDEGDVRVIVDCPKNLAVMTDGLRLKQVLLNLGSNATKFVRSGFIRLHASVVDGMAELSVEDSGPGIPVERRKLLFKKYHTSLDVVTQGNGIGLSLCKNLVTLLKGDIWLDESYDSGVSGFPGARFVVRLKTPLVFPPEGTRSSSNDETEKGATSCLPDETPTSIPHNLSVLFVDDDSVLRKLFIRSLSRVCPNWNVTGVASGESAIKCVLGETESGDEGSVEQPPTSFDLIFVDQYMASTEPQLLGTETIAYMRSRGVDCTICGLSANDMEKEFSEAGADYFMLKPLPFERPVLEAALLRVTGRIRTAENVTLNGATPLGETIQ
eukprot:scaffold407_cov168-Amphora_coffeaeformis.AAC.9